MALTEIPPAEANKMLKTNAVIVDVREPTELIHQRVPDAIEFPLSRIGREHLALEKKQRPIFLCRSGMRTRASAARLAEQFKGQGFSVQGGLVAWRQAGLPVEVPNDPVSTRARLATNVITGISAAGFAVAIYGIVMGDQMLGLGGGVSALAATVLRNPVISALLRSRK